MSVFQLSKALNNTNHSIDLIGVGGDGTTLTAQVWNENTSTELGGSTLTVGWHKIWIVRESTTSLKVYLDGVLDITNIGNITGRPAVSLLDIGRTNVLTFQGEYWDGKITALKMWNTVLTTDELARESAQYLPVRTANLHAFNPLRGDDDGLDLSGNGRHLTANGSPYMEEAPNIIWSRVTDMFF